VTRLLKELRILELLKKEKKDIDFNEGGDGGERIIRESNKQGGEYN